VVPVKLLAVAKTRLTLPDARRQELALAFALDTVEVALSTPGVRLVCVVTDERTVGDEAGRLGAVVVPDTPRAGLNAALQHGARAVGRAGAVNGVVGLAADLPALRAADLAAVLASASLHRRAVVADTLGRGSVLLSALAGVPLRPRFGPGSRAAHVDAGAVDLTGVAPASLRRDVDTTEDLRTAAAMGLGRRSAALVATSPLVL
jgi:2-phospho-L-lactate guanylyltransferase